MKTLTKQAIFVLPAMVLLSLVGWWLFGALTEHALTDDLLTWMAELPIVTCYALATLVAAMLAMQVTGMNLPNDYRAELLQRAANGDFDAWRVLRFEALSWFAMLFLASFFLWPKR